MYTFSPIKEIFVRSPLLSYDKIFNDSWKKIILHDKRFEEAIFWSSPTLHKMLLKLKSGELPENKKEKVFNSLYKYFVRICCRSTPFGISAGFNLQSTETAYGNSVQDDSRSNEKRIVTPDLDFLTDLIDALVTNTKVYSVMDFYKNPSLYRVGERYRFYEKFRMKGKYSG